MFLAHVWSLRHKMFAGLLAGLASLTILGVLAGLPWPWFWVSLPPWSAASLGGLWAMLRNADDPFFSVCPKAVRFANVYVAVSLCTAFGLADPLGQVIDRILADLVEQESRTQRLVAAAD